MKIYPIETGNFKLDGGAMFGVVPKVLWQKTNPADSNNLIDMSLRCMLIEDGNQLILIDNGAGNKQTEKFWSHYYLFGDFTLDTSLAKLGFHRDDITDVFLTHLHFDHCGGSVQFNKGKTLVFMADLLPTSGHVPLPYVMGYDTRPLLTMNEKQQFLNLAAKKNFILFLEHDPQNELCTVKNTEKGVRLEQTYSFNEVFN